MKPITEEMKVHEEWYKESPKNIEELAAFITRLLGDYQHDYGTICHALAAGAIATCKMMDNSAQGGITGFQAGAIMWEFMKHWNDIGLPARLIDFNNLLYPQYEYEFNSISEDTWSYIREEARKKLSDRENLVHPDVYAHWKSIADGKVPFGLRIKD
jgi:hypothetical protein